MGLTIERIPHYKVCENRTSIEYYFLIPKDENTLTGIMQPVFCKDYFQDLFKAMYLKKNFTNIYDISYKYKASHDVFKNDTFMLSLNTTFDINPGVNNDIYITDIINKLESCMKFKTFSTFKKLNMWNNDKIVYLNDKQAAELTKTKIINVIKDKANNSSYLICTISTEWLKQPWLSSFLLEFLRNIFYIKYTDVLKYFNAVKELHYLLHAKSYIFNSIDNCIKIYENIIKHGYVELENANWDTNPDINVDFHNNSGFVSNYDQIVENYKKYDENRITECISGQ